MRGFPTDHDQGYDENRHQASLGVVHQVLRGGQHCGWEL